jgi:NADH:ubiquinone oxidoreductase subunit H
MNQLPTNTIYPVHNFVGDMVRHHFPAAAGYANGFLTLVSLLLFVALLPVLLIWLERKVCAHFQARLGPMRVGYHGLLQSTADGLKLLFKEVLMPKGADKFVFFLAPILPASASFLVMTILPFDHHLQWSWPFYRLTTTCRLPIPLAASSIFLVSQDSVFSGFCWPAGPLIINIPSLEPCAPGPR